MGARFLGWEDPLEEEMANHFSILLEESHWQRHLAKLQSMGSQRVGRDWATKQSHHLNPEAALQGSLGGIDGEGILTSNFIVRKLFPVSFQFLSTSRRKSQFDANVPLTSLKLWFISLTNKETRCLRVKAFCRQCYLDRSQMAFPVSNRKLMLQSITGISESSSRAGSIHVSWFWRQIVNLESKIICPWGCKLMVHRLCSTPRYVCLT